MVSYGATYGQPNIQQLLQTYGYQYQNAGGDINRVAQDVQSLLHTCRSLSPRGGQQYTNPNGKVVTLISLDGTCQIEYKGSTYHIPIKIWIPELYPLTSPICYVTPTTDMVVTPRHPYVQSDGLVVHFQYLHSWQAGVSTLVGLVAELSATFSERPPCQAKPPGYGSSDPGRFDQRTSSSISNHQQSSYQLAAGRKGSVNTTLAAGGYASKSTGGSSLPSYDNVQPPAYSTTAALQASILARTASSSVSQTERVTPAATTSSVSEENDRVAKFALETLESILNERKKEQDGALKMTVKLERGKTKLENGIAALKEQRDNLKVYIKTMKAKNANIAQWLVENETEDSADETDPEKLLAGGDAWSDQMFDQVALISAIDDLLFELDEAMKAKKIDLESFLRQVRRLSSRQFEAKALAKKIRGLQEKHPPRRARFVPSGDAPPSYWS